MGGVLATMQPEDPVPAIERAPGRRLWLPPRLPWQYLRPALAAAALALALVTQFNVSPHSALTGAGVAFIIAALLFVAAIWGRRELGAAPQGGAAGFDPPRWLEVALLAGIVGLAAFFRFYRFLSFPPGLWYDEGVNGTDAITIMERDHLTVWRSSNFGHSTIFFYLLIASFKLFGFTLFAMRIVPALAGLAAVVAFYFLARRLLGPLPALAAAAFYAVSRYAITFSRISWEASLMPLLETMAVYFLVTGLEQRSKWRLALGGGSLAAGIYTYLAFRFVPVIIIVFLLYIAWREWALIRRNLAGLAVWAVAGILVFAPLGQFALRHQDEFMHRTRAVSVFNEIDRKGSWEPLRHNIEASIKMMNVAGDRNGRHNLPGEPMLDDVSAALLVLGAAASIWAWRRWRAGFALPWLVLTLVPGALTIEIENPSAIRGIGSLPPLFLVIGLAVAGLYRTAAADRRLLAIFVVGMFALLGVSAWLNFHTLYDRQAKDMDVFEGFQPVYTKIGEEIRDNGKERRVLVSDQLLSHPAVLTLAHKVPRAQLTPNNQLPLSLDPAAQDVLLLFDPGQGPLVDAYRQFYPDARYEEVRDQFGRPFYSRLWISYADVERVRNLRASYSSLSPSQTATVQRLEAPVHSWPQDLPDGISTPFAIEWTGSIQVPAANAWEFELLSSGPVHLEIDGRSLLDGPAGTAGPVQLVAGLHSLRARAEVVAPTGQTSLRWKRQDESAFHDIPVDVLVSRDVRTEGLVATYYRGTQWQGEVLTTARQIFPGPETYTGAPYSVDLRSTVVVDRAGSYEFRLNAFASAFLFIDDQLVIDAGGSHPLVARTGAIQLDPGPHAVTIRYDNPAGWPSWWLEWLPPGATDWARVPNDRFQLPSATPPAAAMTVKTAIDQAWGARGRAIDGVASPRSVAFDPRGRMLLAEPSSGRIAVLDAQGTPAGEIRTPLDQISDMAVATDGRIAAVDVAGGRLAVLSPDGSLLFERGAPELDRPLGAVWGPDERLWVVDIRTSSLIAFRMDGSVERYTVADETRAVRQPVAVTVDESGRLYLLTIEDPHVWVFDPATGEVVRSWPAPGGFGSAPPRLTYHQGLVVVGDAEGGRLSIYDKEGRLRGSIHLPPGDPAKPYRPGGLAFGPDGALYVADPSAGVVFRITVAVERPPAGQ